MNNNPYHNNDDNSRRGGDGGSYISGSGYPTISGAGSLPSQSMQSNMMMQQQQQMGGMVPAPQPVMMQHDGSVYSQQHTASVYSQQMVPMAPPMQMNDDVSELGGRTLESRARSIAGSAALVPKAKYSWASESLGTQSTVMTRRSLATASVPEPEQVRSSTAAVEGRLWASFAWIVTFMIPNKCIMRPTKDAKQAWREKVALFVLMVSCCCCCCCCMLR